MKLYDIRKALERIVQINEGLDRERLLTLLNAAGWENEDVIDAMSMWESKTYASPEVENTSTDLVLKEEIFPSTETLEDATTIFAETSLSDVGRRGDASNGPEMSGHSDTATSEEPPAVITSIEKESHEEVPETTRTAHVSKQTSHDELPHNLPLRPSDLAGIAVLPADYEKSFNSRAKHHVETMESHSALVNGSVSVEPKVEIPTPVAPAPEVLVLNKAVPETAPPIYINKIKEAPLETEDKYLAFIAIVLFIIIMFILGYMHIIGRI